MFLADLDFRLSRGSEKRRQRRNLARLQGIPFGFIADLSRWRRT